ncbi:MAG: hypothetical protein ABIH21_05500, partial [Patescibacteria group bacterium]
AKCGECERANSNSIGFIPDVLTSGLLKVSLFGLSVIAVWLFFVLKLQLQDKWWFGFANHVAGIVLTLSAIVFGLWGALRVIKLIKRTAYGFFDQNGIYHRHWSNPFEMASLYFGPDADLRKKKVFIFEMGRGNSRITNHRPDENWQLIRIDGFIGSIPTYVVLDDKNGVRVREEAEVALRMVQDGVAVFRRLVQRHHEIEEKSSEIYSLNKRLSQICRLLSGFVVFHRENRGTLGNSVYGQLLLTLAGRLLVRFFDEEERERHAEMVGDVTMPHVTTKMTALQMMVALEGALSLALDSQKDQAGESTVTLEPVQAGRFDASDICQ